ncbi:MAG: hypothetical protein V4508_25945 [Pseudomonadota bacterium]
MILFCRSTFLTACASLALTIATASIAQAAPSYGFSVRMSGFPDNTAAYAFSLPEFTFTNLSSAGIGISKISMNDGSSTPGGLWDWVLDESASAGVGYTLTQGDRVNDSGWGTTIAYDMSGFDSGTFFSFSIDPDTLHCCGGNVPDARAYVFSGGTATALFTNGAAITLTWNQPVAQSFSPLQRPDLLATDTRNIFYEMSGMVGDAAAVPEPATAMLVLLGFAVMRARRAGSAGAIPA